MRCFYQCQDCSRTHDLALFTVEELSLLRFWFLIDPPRPFTRGQWMAIIEAEMTRKSRT